MTAMTEDNGYQPANGHPSNLPQSGAPPKTRVGSANEARSIFGRLWEADRYVRGARRARVKGLIDGNPPYRASDLKNAGRDWQCNINFRVSESYIENAVGSFYDLYHEAPTYATIQLKSNNYEEAQRWSQCVTKNFDWLLRYEPTLDFEIQTSQGEMVTYGCGPLMFQDVFDWRPVSVLNEKLKVPEFTRSDVSQWEYCTIEKDYTSDELWKYIMDESAAKALGWNVARVKQAIIRASPVATKGGLYQSWEYHQQQLKNGAIDYGASSNTISVVHLLFREFTKPGDAEGKITHDIFVRDTDDGDKPDTFLFQKIGRYDNWQQVMHPMYYDRGIGGYHHGVTGMGVKMYSAMELQNRLMCANADKAFSPKLFFKPTSSTSAEDFSIVQHSDYGVAPEGFDVMQTPMNGFMEEGLVFNRELTNLVASNLSAYRTNMVEPMKGNPDTATQVKLDASKEASLQKTQMNRYYAQCDALYSEMYRRAISAPNKKAPGGERAIEFVERCKRDGVPPEALKNVEFVKATRVVGQGSEFLRQQSTEFLFGTVLPMLPEGGRTNLIDDVIASRAGYSAVDRYNPRAQQSKLPSDQEAIAMGQVADMKIGVPAVVTETQNPVIFAGLFLQAADQAAASLEQGADPAEVARFLDLDGQAIAQHLQRMSQDPSRKAVVKQMTEQWKKVAQVHDQLVEMLQQKQQEQQEHMAEMQQQQSAMNAELMLAKQKQDAELAMKAEKTRFSIQEKQAKTAQAMSIKDAQAAQNIRNKSIAHQQQMRQSEEKGSDEE